MVAGLHALLLLTHCTSPFARRLYHDTGNWRRMRSVVRQLKHACQERARAAAAGQGLHPGAVAAGLGAGGLAAGGFLPGTQGSQLLEVYALEIQMYTALKDNKKLKNIYEKSLRIKSAIAHPRVLAVIRECGGKMHMRAHEWSRAQTDFFEAFKSYDEAGDRRRTQCLKYLVLANMLMASRIDPFASQETKPYRDLPEIRAMTDLVRAFQDNEIDAFERILRRHRAAIMARPTDNDLRNRCSRNTPGNIGVGGSIESAVYHVRTRSQRPGCSFCRVGDSWFVRFLLLGRATRSCARTWSGCCARCARRSCSRCCGRTRACAYRGSRAG